MDAVELAEFAAQISPLSVFGVVVGAFALLYLGFALGAQALCGRVLPALGVGAPISTEPLPRGQIGREARASLVSVLIFGLYGVVTVWALGRGLLRVTAAFEPATIALDCLLLVLWNEAHFYAVHRLLHRPWLLRHVHANHHRSWVPTPFSTYSFHWVEAALLGSVMLTAMLLHDLHVVALLLLPVFSLAANTAGHCAYDLFPAAGDHDLLAMSRRHAEHHRLGSGNFGFLLPWLDLLCGTALPTRSAASPPRPRLRLPLLLGPRTKYLAGAIVLALTIGVYALTNRWHLTQPTPLSPSPLDRLVPFAPWTAWIYASYPLLFSAVFVLERSAARASRFLYAVLAINAVSELVFLLLPTSLDRSPFLLAPGGSLLAWIQALDTPFNCLPSLHVSAACLAGLVAWRGRWRVRGLFVAWALLISLSTLTTKQHLVADVLSGGALAVFAHWFFFTQVDVGPAVTPAPAEPERAAAPALQTTAAQESP